MYVPAGFKRLKYQEEAVLSARKVLDEYGGVFLSDVVGLGKTYMSALLAQQLDGRLSSSRRRTCWTNTIPAHGPTSSAISACRIRTSNPSASWRSLLERDLSKYTTVFIDESHRFRTKTRRATKCSRKFAGASGHPGFRDATQ